MLRIFLFFVLFLNFSFLEAKETDPILFSAEEQLFIKEHPVIKVGGEMDWPPFDFVDENGNYQGVANDMLAKIEQQSGLKFDIITGYTWNQLLDMGKSKQIDLLPVAYFSKERLKYFKFTKPYINLGHYIFMRKGQGKDVKNISDLNGKRLAVIKGYATIDLIKDKGYDIELVLVDNVLEGLNSILLNKADAYIDIYSVVNYSVNKNTISGIEAVAKAGFEKINLHMMVRKDYDLLHSILQKSLDSLSYDEKYKIYQKWSGIDKENDTDDVKFKEVRFEDILPLKELFTVLFIIIILLIITVQYFRKHSDSDISFKGPIGIFVTLFLIFITLMTMLTLHNLHNKQINDLKSSLNIVLNTTHKSLHLWLEKQMDTIDFVTEDIDFIWSVNALVQGDYSEKENIKSYMEDYKKLFQNEDYYIASLDYDILMTSSKDVISKDKIHKHYSNYLSKAIQYGESFVPPFANNGIRSDKIYLIKRITFNNQNIALLVFSINPNKEFSTILNQGRLGKTGETYVVNKKGLMASYSRFDNDLKKLGILEESESSFLNVELVTKKNNMTKSVKSVLRKETAFNVEGYKDYRGIEVFGTWRWMDEFNLGLISEIDKSEAVGQIDNMERIVTIVIFSIVLFAIILTFLIIWLSEKSKKTLQSKNEELNQILEAFNKNVIASRTDLKGRITYASDAFCKVSGFTKEELVGRPHNVIRHPDVPKEVFVDMWRTLKNGKNWYGEVKNLKKDGGFYWTKVYAQPEYDSNGVHVGYSAIRDDITAQKEVEELTENLEHKVEERTKELDAERAFVESIISSSNDAIVVIDTKSSITTWNESAEKIFGYTKDEMIGESVELIVPKKFRASHQSYIDRFVEEGDARFIGKGIVELEAVHKNGHAFPIELALNSFKIDDKLYFSANIRDITQRKELEQKILDNQDQMTFVSQYANFGFWTFNPQIGNLLVNDVFVNMLGYDPEDVLEKGYDDNMFKPFKDGLAFWESLLHPDDVESASKAISAHINGETELYKVDYRMRRADGTWMWSTAIGRVAEYNIDGKAIKFNGVNIDIDDVKNAQIEIKEQRLFLNTLLDSQEQIIITTDGTQLHSINEAFKQFYNIEKMEDFTKDHDCICDTFDIDSPDGYLQKMMGELTWIEYILDNPDKSHKAQITLEDKIYTFSVTAARLPLKGKNILSAVFTNITVLEEQRKALVKLHEKISDSIEYASLIQGALIPTDEVFNEFFDEYFAIWKPRDIVGGDIYLTEKISEDEVVLMVIDCTGHGVPGAFVTMLVKAIERQILSNITIKDKFISPAKMLSIFNSSIKHLLQQESDESISNAGFDAGVLYYNKKEKLVRYAGAEIGMYIIEDDEVEFIKGNRHSIGYKKSDINYQFTDHTINVTEGTKIYITTDGYIDQNGGEKNFPFGKKRFKDIVGANNKLSFEEQKKILLQSLSLYQDDYETNDDITVVGIKL